MSNQPMTKEENNVVEINFSWKNIIDLLDNDDGNSMQKKKRMNIRELSSLKISFFLTWWILRISITIGTAAITRSLSTAAVVQAEFNCIWLNEIIIENLILKTYSSIHAKTHSKQWKSM